MSRARLATIAVLSLRVAYGAALIVAPERMGRRWLGAAAATAPTQVPLRGLGARELILHGGALAAAAAGAPLRPWLAASIAGDLSDITATFAGRRELPTGSPRATLAVAGASLLASGAVALAEPD